MAKEKEKKSWNQRLKSRYRLVILNDDTFEEESSFILSRENIYLLISSVLVTIILGVTAIIVYTPIKEYLPGLDRTELKHEVRSMNFKLKMIQDSLKARQRFIDNMLNVVKGVHDTAGVNKIIEDVNYDSINVSDVSIEDSLLRVDVEKENVFTLFDKDKKRDIESVLFHLFTPVKGMISGDYDNKTGHFGVDIVAPQNTSIKSALDGVVVFADWTLEDGYVLAIMHENDLMTFYKHNSVLHKKIGNFVQAGEIIAVIGNTGERTSGTHLHFELWHKGATIDPTDYLGLN